MPTTTSVQRIGVWFRAKYARSFEERAFMSRRQCYRNWCLRPLIAVRADLTDNRAVSTRSPLRRLSRRAVLELLGVGLASAAASRDAWSASPGSSRIARIEVFPVRYPMRGRFKFFEGPDGSPTG